jgi:hypothetical protein
MHSSDFFVIFVFLLRPLPMNKTPLSHIIQAANSPENKNKLQEILEDSDVLDTKILLLYPKTREKKTLIPEIDLNLHNLQDMEEIIENMKNEQQTEKGENEVGNISKLKDVLARIKGENETQKEEYAKIKKKVTAVINNSNQLEFENKYKNFKKRQTTVAAHCNKKLITGFGVHGETIDTFREIDNYCANNQMSCCNNAHLDSIRNSVLERINKIASIYDYVEEIYSLFQGPRVIIVLNSLRKNKQCHYVIQNNSDLNCKTTDEFFERHSKKYIESINSFLRNLKNYINDQKKHYTSFLCAICNPSNSKYFFLNETGTDLIVNLSHCTNMLESLDFEIKMIKIYQKFIKVITDMYKCSKNWVADKNYAIKPVYYGKIDAINTNFRQCVDNLDLNKRSCLKICKMRNLVIYKLPVEFFESLIHSGKILFPAFLNISMDQFYAETGRTNPIETINDKPIPIYYNNNPNYFKFKLENINLLYDPAQGIRIKGQKMGRQFFKVSANFEKLMVMIFIPLLLFF